MTPIEILERTFKHIPLPAFEGDCERGMCGVYMLVDGDEIVYVGKSDEIGLRVLAHARRDRRFDRVLWVALPSKVHPHYEGAFIRALRPKLNRNAPEHCGYDNEILEGFGLEPHEDEYLNALTWLAERPETPARQRTPMSRRILRYRSLAGISQRELGRRCGCSGAAVALWESASSSPSTDSVSRIADAFGMTLSEFYADESEVS